jgi:hypothetical protein
VIINLADTDTLKVSRIDEEVVLLIKTLTINKANAAHGMECCQFQPDSCAFIFT